jgi:hypothetical protein
LIRALSDQRITFRFFRFLGRKKRPQRRYLVLQHVSDARARPCELPYLFPSSASLVCDRLASVVLQIISASNHEDERAGVPAIRFLVSGFPESGFPDFRKSHAICGTVCGAPREAFSSFVFPEFLDRANDDVEQLQLAAQYDVGSFQDAFRILKTAWVETSK